MLNVDSQDWWMWQMYRATAEFMHTPNDEREARLNFFMSSYRYFHLQQQGTQHDEGQAASLTVTTATMPSLAS